MAPTFRTLLTSCLVGLAGSSASGADTPSSVETRALRYLAVEVPRWSAENKCFSCHNNGDAARALYAGRPLTPTPAVADVPPKADPLADTSRWLTRPALWDHNGGDGPFSDKVLARVQFTAALAAAGLDREALAVSARRLAADQSAEGFWPVESQAPLGSPAGYGRPLATLMARDALRAADPNAFRPNLLRADRWLLSRPVRGVMGASITLMALDGRDPDALDPSRSAPLRAEALDLLRKAQGADGGWGPYPETPPEPFDTALALLALARDGLTGANKPLAVKGRAFLRVSQNPDGSWTETTRPAGAESYAQRLSTAGWCTLALLATRAVD